MTVKKKDAGARPKEVYLGKKGKVFGPFTEEEFETFHTSKKIDDYTFIWNPESETWTTIEAPPPHPGAKAEGKTKRSGKGTDWNEVRVFCHNFIQGVGGYLEGVTETGCDLLTSDGEDHPRFAQQVPLLLNVMDTEQQKSWNIKVTLSHSERRENHWLYRLRWEGIPSLK